MTGTDAQDGPSTGRATVDRPNIILIMSDQHRADCLSVEAAHPVLTPNLDRIANEGARFTRCYSTSPICIPARRSLLSGQFPASHGLAGNVEGLDWDPPHTLPGELRAAGYQTQLVGRSMHQHPRRRRYGFDEMVTLDEDYQPWLDGKLATATYHNPYDFRAGPTFSTGIMHNDLTARPWPYAEELHPTNWAVHQAKRFLQRRDPSCPYFLALSILAPHPPLTPPPFYYDRYHAMKLPDAAVGDWAEPGHAAQSRALRRPAENDISAELRQSFLAGYYGSINHMDDQIRRVIYALDGTIDPTNTIIVYTTDHGEMAGDHYLWAKSQPYEGSARIPLLMQVPEQLGGRPGMVVDEPACLEDIMPTLLDLAGVAVPDSVEGQSLVPHFSDAGHSSSAGQRRRIHIENAPGYHALTDGQMKYIWFVADGREQLFDLRADPSERHDLARDRSTDSAGHDQLTTWRAWLVEELSGRPEGFVRDGQLVSGVAYEAQIPPR